MIPVSAEKEKPLEAELEEINHNFLKKFENSKEKYCLDVLQKYRLLTEALEIDPESENKVDLEITALIKKTWLNLAEKFGVNGERAFASPYSFHDLSHTIEFMEAQLEIFASLEKEIKSGGIKVASSSHNLEDKKTSQFLKKMMVLGGAYHDIEQDAGPEKNELESRKKFKEDAEKFLGNRVSKDTIDLVSKGIEATIVDDYSAIIQRVELPSEENPSSGKPPTLSLEFLIQGLFADADMSAFLKYSQQHWRGNRLFWEFRNKQALKKYQDNRLNSPSENEKEEILSSVEKEPLNSEETLNWLQSQINIIKAHQQHFILKKYLGLLPPYHLPVKGVPQEILILKLYELLIKEISSQDFPTPYVESEYLKRIMTKEKKQADAIKKQFEDGIKGVYAAA